MQASDGHIAEGNCQPSSSTPNKTALRQNRNFVVWLPRIGPRNGPRTRVAVAAALAIGLALIAQ